MTLGAQLFTLREFTQTEKDLDYSLSQVAQMGYETVQLSAIGPIAPQTVRELCGKHGLSIVLTHTDPNRILNDTEAVIQEHELYGCDYIGIGMMPQKYRSPAWFWRFAEDYREPAKKIAAAGKLLMYHNHNLEFQKFAGKLVMDSLLEAFAPQELGFTLDTYWVQMGGANPVEWMEKLSGRIPCIHLKDMAVQGYEPVMAPVGEGNLNFPAILQAASRCGVKHLLVEQDLCQGSPFGCLETSLSHVRAMMG